MRTVAALILVALMLAGCTSPEAEDPEPTAEEASLPDDPADASAQSGNVTQAREDPVPANQTEAEPSGNTLHITGEGQWTLQQPNGSEPHEIPLRVGNTVMLWDYTFASNATLAGGFLEVWYRVTGPMAHHGVEPSPFTCTISTSLRYSHIDGSTTSYGEGCYWASPGMLGEGEYRATIPLDLHEARPVEVVAGDELELQVNLHVIQGSTEPVFHLLGGTPDGTRLQLDGMAEPLAPSA